MAEWPTIPAGYGYPLVNMVTKLFNQPTMDALSATYSRRDSTPLNVKDFGAVGDGVADDTAAIQAALDSVSFTGSELPGVHVFFPSGIYRITDTIVCNHISFSLVGSGLGDPPTISNPDGMGTRIKWAGPDGDPMFHVTDCKNTLFQDMHLMGNDTNPPSEGIFYEKVSGETGGNNSNLGHRRVVFGYMKESGDTDYAMDIHVRFGGINGDNDEFVFDECEFWKATNYGIKIDNTQTIWGNLTNCLFAADNAALVRMIGISTSSSFQGERVSFDSCQIDIQVLSTAHATIYGYFSERARKCVSVVNDRGRFFAYGGLLNIQDAEVSAGGDGFYMESLCTSTGGGIALDGVKINYGAVGTRPKLKARGLIGAAVGMLSIRNCNMLMADLDVVAAASGSGIAVMIDDVGIFHRSVLNVSATLNPITSLSPEWTDYVPTISGTGWALGNATYKARYSISGKTVNWCLSITWGSTSTFGAGGLLVSIPVNAKTTSHEQDLIVASALDSGSASYQIAATYNSNDKAQPWSISSSHVFGLITATLPFAWATGDILRLAGAYEMA